MRLSSRRCRSLAFDGVAKAGLPAAANNVDPAIIKAATSTMLIREAGDWRGDAVDRWASLDLLLAQRRERQCQQPVGADCLTVRSSPLLLRWGEFAAR